MVWSAPVGFLQSGEYPPKSTEAFCFGLDFWVLFRGELKALRTFNREEQHIYIYMGKRINSDSTLLGAVG